jgi:peptidoglycan/LPS O-acetylase OafA/YrhL
MGFAIGHAVYFVGRLGLRPRIPKGATLREIVILLLIALIWNEVTGTRAIVVMPFLFGIMVAIYSGPGGLVSRMLERPALQALGTWSYSIYMVHGLLLYIMSQAVSLAEGKLHVPVRQTMERGGREVPTIVLDNLLLGDVALVVYLGLVIALSAATYRWIEAPARRAFNDWGQQAGGFPVIPHKSAHPAPSRVGLQAGRR